MLRIEDRFIKVLIPRKNSYIVYYTRESFTEYNKDQTEGKWLADYITDKYAGMLTEEDIATLFNLLAKELGENRSEAARQCGLTGKATYDWEEATYVKLGTKKKVLQASLKKNFLATLEYLFKRSTDRSEDLLRTILATLYADAIEAVSKEEFEAALNKFTTLQTNHQGIINDGIRDEVTDMTSLMREKAVELAVPFRAKTIHEMLPEEIADEIQTVGQLYLENPSEAELFAERDLSLPTEFLKQLMQTFRNLCSAKRTQTSAMTENRKIQGPTAATAIRPLWTVKQGHIFSFGPIETAQQVEITQKEEPRYAATTST